MFSSPAATCDTQSAQARICASIMPRSVSSFLALLGLLAMALPARAQPVGKPKPVVSRSGSSAESVLLQAEAAIESRDFPTAYRLLAAAYQAQPQPLFLHGLARLAIAEARTVEAQDLWRRFLADPSLDSAAPARAVAQQQLLAVPLTAAGEVSVGAPRGALIELDGRVVGVAPLSAPLLVRSGRHRVAVTLSRWRAETEVTARTARLSELRFKEGADAVVVSLPAAVLYVDAYPASLLSAGSPAASAAAAGGGEVTGSPLLDPLLDPLTQAAAAALKRESYVLLPQRLAVAFDDPGAGCAGSAALTEACSRGLASRYGVESLLRVAVSREAQTFRIEVTLFDVQVDDVAGSASSTCSGCTPQQVASKLSEAIAQVLTTASGRARGTLSAVSEPAGAELRLGRQVLGSTPLVRKLWAGSYEIRISRAGHQPYVQQIDVKNGETTHIEAALVPQGSVATVPTPPTPASDRAHRRTRLILWAAGGASVVAGAVLLGFGASALAANGSCATPGLTDLSLCRRVYDTALPGGVMTAVGGALIVGGGVALMLPLLRKPK